MSLRDLKDLPFSHTNTTSDAAIAAAGTKAMGGAAVGGVLGWATSNESMAALSLLLAVSGFIVNLVFKYRQDRREEMLYGARLEQIKQHENGQQDRSEKTP